MVGALSRHSLRREGCRAAIVFRAATRLGYRSCGGLEIQSNMKRLGWLVPLGLSLLVASVVLYAVQYAIFRDAHQLFIYLLGDIAFLPICLLYTSPSPRD